MTNRLFLITLLSITVESSAQLRGTFEKIYYFEPQGNFSMGPIAQIQNNENWYAEVRYNYEAARTFSLYIGKVYSREADFSYSIIPIFGGVLGMFKGGSAGLNLDLEFKKFYFSSQTQYSFSAESEEENFYFSWSELGYQPLKWFYVGVAVQPLYYPQSQQSLISSGVVVGFCYKNWTVPVYVFDPLRKDETFICSILYEWQK